MNLLNIMIQREIDAVTSKKLELLMYKLYGVPCESIQKYYTLNCPRNSNIKINSKIVVAMDSIIKESYDPELKLVRIYTTYFYKAFEQQLKYVFDSISPSKKEEEFQNYLKSLKNLIYLKEEDLFVILNYKIN
jgi:hypothetical protein